MDLEALKYPIGKFSFPEKFGKPELELAIESIEKFPDRIKDAVNGFSQAQLDTPYRPQGWTVRQLIHHCVDSHINSIIRFKLALTEDNPTILPYQEHLWAELADCQLDIEPSIKILEGLHLRWTTLLKSLSDEQWEKTFMHPDHIKPLNLREAAAMYAWHCNHHLSHITQLIKRENWR